MTGEARVHLPNMHDIVPRPMPSKDEVAKMFQRSSQLQRVKERRFNEWFTTPLDGELWGAWGMKARPDKVGMTYMAVNKVSPAAEPADVGGARVVLTRYVKPDSRLSPEQEERVNPKYGGSRELDHKYDVWIDDAPQLAEEALERQWRPSRTLRWEEMRPPAPRDREGIRPVSHLHHPMPVPVLGHPGAVDQAGPLQLPGGQELPGV